MWKRKTLKQQAKAALKANYLRCVITLLIMMVVSGQAVLRLGEIRTNALPQSVGSNGQVVNDLVSNVTGGELDLAGELTRITGATSGVLTTLLNNTSASGSLLFGVINSANQLLFGGRIAPTITLAIGIAIGFVFWLLVQNILQVGQARFFLENRRYPATGPGRLLFLYRLGKVRNAAKIMFFRGLYQLLWAFTIVGGLIKLYSYRMIPFLLAENPNITRKEAFRLSRRMMQGNKWRAFVLDASFWGWQLLDLITFGLVGAFWLSPYKAGTDAELYIALRAEVLEQSGTEATLLNDPWLETVPADAGDNYPLERFPIPQRQGRRLLSGNYARHYSLTDYVLLFFSFAFIGYLYEVLYYLISTGVFVNRGTMYGPWLPIYGCGGVLTLLLLHRFAEKPLLTFFLSMGVCGVIEYTAAWFLETFLHTKWWDYTGFFLNLQGRVCAEGLIVFGLGCCLGIYVLSPSLAQLYGRLPKKLRGALAIGLSALFAIDFVFSALHPNVAGGIPA